MVQQVRVEAARARAWREAAAPKATVVEAAVEAKEAAEVVGEGAEGAAAAGHRAVRPAAA